MGLLYAYTPQIWPSLLTVLLLAALAFYSGRRRSLPGATPFLVACLFAAAWAACTVMEYAILDVSAKFAWHKAGIVFQTVIIIAIVAFFLEYAWPGRWLTPRTALLLYLPYLPAFFLQFSYDPQPIFLRFVYANKVTQQFGPYGWFILAYTFLGLGGLALSVCVWLFRRSPQHRWPAALMIVGQITGRTIYILDVTGAFHSTMSIHVLGMASEFLVYAVALFGFRILDPIILARQALAAQLRDGLLVVDRQDRVAALNPVAERIFGAADRLIGQPAGALLPVLPETLLTGERETEIELSLGDGPAQQQYNLHISPLQDFRGLAVGTLLMLHDITDQRQAQAQIIAQQRALAMLREREQLARELHDSTGQVLAYAGFQLEAAHERIQAGLAALSAGQAAAAGAALATADEQIRRLGGAIEAAHADLREEILNLRLAPGGGQPLTKALEHYLELYRQNYAMQIELAIADGVDADRLYPEAQLELFRVVQETLSNARKHGQPSCVQIRLEQQDDWLRIQVQDDGRGFDPAQAGHDGHYGLRFMRERVEKLGGQLQIESSPGAGTRITVEVALGGEHDGNTRC